MDYPKFIEDALAARPIYQHLFQNEKAKLQINHAVADFESKFSLERRNSSWWSIEVPHLNDLGITQIDRDCDGILNFEADAPVTWKRSVEHLSELFYYLCVAVTDTADSPTKLHELSDCLSAMVEPFMLQYYDTKLNSWATPEIYRLVFVKALEYEMHGRIESLVSSCWEWYRKRLNAALDEAHREEGASILVFPVPAIAESSRVSSAIPEPPEAESRSVARKSVVEPILIIKGWTRSRWASEAGVGKNCAYDYLDAKRNLSAENRRALAEVLDLRPEDLPNE